MLQWRLLVWVRHLTQASEAGNFWLLKSLKNSSTVGEKEACRKEKLLRNCHKIDLRLFLHVTASPFYDYRSNRSSTGRISPCHGEGSGFESHLLLFYMEAVAERLRRRIMLPVYMGSNPISLPVIVALFYRKVYVCRILFGGKFFANYSIFKPKGLGILPFTPLDHPYRADNQLLR